MSIKLGNDRDMSYIYRQSRDTVIRGNTLVTTKEVPYFTISSDETFTTEMLQKRWNGTLYYSIDKYTWTEWDGSEIEGKKIYFRGIGNTTFYGNTRANDTIWSIQGSGIKLSGSLETILDYMQVYNDEHPAMDPSCFQYLFGPGSEGTPSPGETNPGIIEIEEGLLPATTLAASCYNSMFSYCTGLTSIPGGLLPATTLARSCYYDMFKNCTSLIVVPRLPATALADSCYFEMFKGCTSLTTIPSDLLPATTLKSACYSCMFIGCTSLTALPKLPATALNTSCYEGMFNGCTSLTTVPSDLLPATTLAASCYNDMFRDCTSLIDIPCLPATTLANACYADMFYNCTSLNTIRGLSALELKPECYRNMYVTIVLSTSQDSTYCNEYRVPVEGTGIEKPLSEDESKRALYQMFIDTNGNLFTPVINTTYYTNVTVI